MEENIENIELGRKVKNDFNNLTRTYTEWRSLERLRHS